MSDVVSVVVVVTAAVAATVVVNGTLHSPFYIYPVFSCGCCCYCKKTVSVQYTFLQLSLLTVSFTT